MISIIIPSYKPQAYLWDCLDSVSNQTLSPNNYEIILLLNGCHQPYKQQIEEYVAKHDKICQIRLIQTDTPGVSNARNIGIDASKGDYLTFVDDDDLISQNYLEELLRVSDDKCIGCSNSMCFKESIEKSYGNFISKAYKECKGVPYSIFKYRHFLSSPCGKLIHRKIIGDVRFPVNLAKSEDSVFCLKLTPNVKDMKLASEKTIYYQRIREESVMRRRNRFGYEFATLCKVEIAYLKTWLSNPFRYSFILVVSRMVAGLRNFIWYIR